MNFDKKPLIGITIDVPLNDSYSRYPWYALRANYADAVVNAGGTPIFLPCSLSAVPDYVQLIDGLVISGGDFDINPAYYGEHITNQKVCVNDQRTDFEIALLKAILPLNKPILGICGGMQLINVIAGGTLIQDIEEERENHQSNILHQQPHPKHIPSHCITVKNNTLLYSIVNTERYMVNTTHHQAVKNTSSNIVASAIADDGIIEAIEHINHHFCIGVQWHPEYEASAQDLALFKAFTAYSLKLKILPAIINFS